MGGITFDTKLTLKTNINKIIYMVKYTFILHIGTQSLQNALPLKNLFYFLSSHLVSLLCCAKSTETAKPKQYDKYFAQHGIILFETLTYTHNTKTNKLHK